MATAADTDKSLPNKPFSFLLNIEHISKNDKDRRIVAGFGSLEVIDRQGERITQEAMRIALEKFMAHPEFANTHVMHGNVAVGKVISEYVDKNGEVWKTEVNETGTFIVSEIRPEGQLKRADQTWELIEDGRLKSYSVGGQAISPKEQVCNETGACHLVITEMEIHEFSYVDRPAVKGADFMIVKNEEGLNFQIKNNDLPPTAMTCPLKKSEKVEQTYKEGSPNSDTIIMTDTQADVSEVTDEPEQVVSDVPEEVVEETVDEADKADATPTLLELKAQNEKILNILEQFLPSKDKEHKFDYPEEDVKVLQDTYGVDETFSLLTILGDNYTRLLDKAEEVTAPQEEESVVEATEAEPTSEPETEIEAETVEESAEAPEAETETKLVEEEPAMTKSQIIEKFQVAMEAKLKEFDNELEKYAKVQKRTPGPKVTATKEPTSVLDLVGDIPWGAKLDELAQRGA